MIPHISVFPELTDEDRKTLEKLRGSEAFLIVCKVIAHEWRVATSQMMTCTRDDLVSYQGHALALTGVYNQIMRYANVDVSENIPSSLTKNKKLSNIKDSREK